MEDEGLRKELIDMMNKALRLEHAARIQYLTHAEQVDGLNSEAIIARIKEIAEDEKMHEDMFREMIGGYLGGVPTMDLDETRSASDVKEIIDVNLEDEKDALGHYKNIYKKLSDNKHEMPYIYETLEHELRHIIIDEQEHVMELKQLLGK